MTGRRKPRVRTDLGVIRQVVLYAEEVGINRARLDFQRDYRTVQRWVERHRATGWPTEEDIARWRADDAELAEIRERTRRRLASYRKRVILNRGPLTVPPVGTRRRLQALQANGWTQRELADRLGVSDSRVCALTNGRWERVMLRTARAVEALYDELSMIVPDDPEPRVRGEVRVHERQRRAATVKGWARPLAWDDDEIDDPQAQPHAPKDRHRQSACDEVVVWRIFEAEQWPDRNLTHAEGQLLYRLLVQAGKSTHEIENRYRLNSARYRREAS